MFKRTGYVMLILAFLLIIAAPAGAAPTVIVDGQQMSFEVAPILENDRTLVPLRAIFEQLGCTVAWDNYTRTVTAVRGQVNIKLQIGNSEALVNGEAVPLDVPGRIVNTRTMVPLRFIAESLGDKVNWDATQNQVTITNSGQVPAIGLNLDLTGPVGTYGNNVYKGVQLAFKDQPQFRLVLEDNMSRSGEASASTQKLLQKNIIAQIGPLTSGAVKACSPLLEESRIPLLSPAATAPDTTLNPISGETLKYTYRICLPDAAQGDLMALFISNQLKAKTSALIINNNSNYSSMLAAQFKQTFMHKGGQVVFEGGYYQQDTQFDEILGQVKKLNPDFIYVPGYYPEVGAFIKQARAMGITQPIGGADGWDSPELVNLAGTQALNHTYITNHYAPDDTDQAVVAFTAEYKKCFGQSPDAFAALGYDCGMILMAAINNSNSLEPEAIAASLGKIKNHAGVTGQLTMGPDHNPIKSGVILEYRNGEQVFKQRVYPNK